MVYKPCRLFLVNVTLSWPISLRGPLQELVAALNTAKLPKQAYDALEIPNCNNFFWCDSHTMLQWLKNPDLRLNEFIM